MLDSCPVVRPSAPWSPEASTNFAPNQEMSSMQT